MQRDRLARFVWLGDGWEPIGETARGWARGYAFVDGDTCLEDGEIARYLFAHRARLPAVVAGMNGCFAAALDSDPAPVLITDRYGTVPLYVHRGPEGVSASSDPWQVVAALESQPQLDESGALDLLRTGYVTGTGTLLAGIESVAPATIATIEPGGTRDQRYWRYGYRPEPIEPREAEERLAAVFERIGARTARHLASRGYRPALTVSGGLDSRVLAAVLSAAFPGKLTALTYGTPDNPEVKVARAVSSELGMEFRSAIVTRDYLSDAFIARSVREVGLTTRFTCGLGARHLDSADLDVLIPGHTGDFVSGGHLPAQVGMVRTRSELCRYLEFTHFRYRGSEAVLRRVLRLDYDAAKWRSLEATTAGFDFAEDVFGLIDRWNVENRQRRLILMELRAYEQRGRWMLPFYDHELIDFYARVPHEQRLGQHLYIETAKHRLFAGRAQGLAGLQRIGSRPMRSDPSLPLRIARLRRLQPLSGWFLRFGLAHFRDLARTWKPKPEQVFGTDLIKEWFGSDEKLRDFILARVAALDLELIDARELAAVLRSEGQEERVYNRLLTSALTIRECLDHARASWTRARV